VEPSRKADVGECLASLEGVHPSQNNHGEAGLRQSLATARWTTLDL
jgi:hypothetical protein